MHSPFCLSFLHFHRRTNNLGRVLNHLLFTLIGLGSKSLTHFLFRIHLAVCCCCPFGVKKEEVALPSQLFNVKKQNKKQKVKQEAVLIKNGLLLSTYEVFSS